MIHFSQKIDYGGVRINADAVSNLFDFGQNLPHS